MRVKGKDKIESQVHSPSRVEYVFFLEIAVLCSREIYYNSLTTEKSVSGVLFGVYMSVSQKTCCRGGSNQ